MAISRQFFYGFKICFFYFFYFPPFLFSMSTTLSITSSVFDKVLDRFRAEIQIISLTLPSLMQCQ